MATRKNRKANRMMSSTVVISGNTAEALFRQESVLCQELVTAHLEALPTVVREYIGIISDSSENELLDWKSILLPLCGKIMLVASHAGLNITAGYEWLQRTAEKLGSVRGVNAAQKTLLTASFDLCTLLNENNKYDSGMRLDACRRYIVTHLDRDLTLQSLSERFNYSPSYLCRSFRKTYGENITGYIRRERLKESRLWLENTDKSICEIALAFHFAKAALAEEKETVENAEKWIALIKECGKPTELTAELLNTLIEKILVHEAWKDESHTRHQEIEIVYRFVGKID